ncbi:unnamed protein product [Amoebophrya sp. A25]|nr:unnamed protein product [Amoebophrya sp. A25]|eukprot:GSA25T00019726001.1
MTNQEDREEVGMNSNCFKDDDEGERSEDVEVTNESGNEVEEETAGRVLHGGRGTGTGVPSPSSMGKNGSQRRGKGAAKYRPVVAVVNGQRQEQMNQSRYSTIVNASINGSGSSFDKRRRQPTGESYLLVSDMEISSSKMEESFVSEPLYYTDAASSVAEDYSEAEEQQARRRLMYSNNKDVESIASSEVVEVGSSEAESYKTTSSTSSRKCPEFMASKDTKGQPVLTMERVSECMKIYAKAWKSGQNFPLAKIFTEDVAFYSGGTQKAESLEQLMEWWDQTIKGKQMGTIVEYDDDDFLLDVEKSGAALRYEASWTRHRDGTSFQGSWLAQWRFRFEKNEWKVEVLYDADDNAGGQKRRRY